MATEKVGTDNKGAVGCVALVLLGVLWLYGKCSSDKTTNTDPQGRTPEKIAEDEEKASRAQHEAAAASARAAEVQRVVDDPPIKCGLSIPGTNQRVPVFPTEAGMDEFAGPAASGDSAGMQAALVGNHGYWVPPHTKCNWIHLGLLSTSVRITEGVHFGEEAWVPTEWSRDQ